MIPIWLVTVLLAQTWQPSTTNDTYLFAPLNPGRYVYIRNDETGRLKAADSNGNRAVLPIQCNPLNIDQDDPYWTDCHVIAAPHIPCAPNCKVEIRTHREKVGTDVCSYIAAANNGANASCEHHKPSLTYCPSGSYCEDTFDVTRELWVEGQKIGEISGGD